MLTCESGYFRSPRKEQQDSGFFTVQSVDIPLGVRRQKRHRGAVKISRSRKSRLTPINEYDEIFIETEETFMSDDDVERELMSPMKITITPRGGAGSQETMATDECPSRSDTPIRTPSTPKLQINFNSYSEELTKIPEGKLNKTRDSDVSNMVSKMPVTRPKCKRKVLPPSVTPPNCSNAQTISISNRTTSTSPDHPKRNKLLRLRARVQNNKVHVDSVTQPHSYKVSKDLQRVMTNQTLRLLNASVREQDAKSRNKNLHVLKLSDMDYTSVPDLPSIINCIQQHNEINRADSNTPTKCTQSARLADDDKHDHKSALLTLTPRDDNSTSVSDATADTASTGSKSLRGSDLSSFYHVWEQDTKPKRRPFERRDSVEKVVPPKPRLTRTRSCYCALQNCGKNRCATQRNTVLPPIHSYH